MAITNNGTKVSLGTGFLPTGYTKPSVTIFSDHEYIRDITVEVDKVTVDDATKATTLTNIVGNATVGITKQIDDILAATYIASQTVTAYTEFYDVNSNIKAGTGSDFYNADLVTYVCKCRLYIKAV